MSEDKIQVKIEADASDFEGALKDAIAHLSDSIKEMKNGFASMSEGIKASMQESAAASGQAAKQITDGMKQSAAETSQAVGTLSQSLKGLHSDMDRAAATQGFSSGMKEAVESALALTASVFSLHTVLDLFKSGIAFNAQMEQAAISLETMLKSSEKAKKMISDLQKMAAETPFEFPDLQNGAKRMLAFGFSAEMVLPTLKAVGDAAAGLGMSGKEGIDRIVLALGQMQAKGKVSGEEMLQMTEAGIPAWDILARSIGKTTGEVMKMAEQGAIPADKAIQALIVGMEERFPNMMQKQSKSFSGMMSTIRDTFSTVVGDIVKPGFEELCNEVLPKVAQGLEQFAVVMKKSGTTAAFKTIFSPAVVEAAVGAAKVVGGALEFIRQHASFLTAAVTGLTVAFGFYRGVALVSAIVTAAQAVAFSVQTGAVALATRGTAAFTIANIAATAATIATTLATEGLAAGFTALAAAMNINPIILAITLAIAGLAACIYLVYDNWEAFKGWCISFWNGIVDLIADNIGIIMVMFPRLAIIIFLIYECWDEGVKLISGVWQDLTNFLDRVANVISRIIDDVGKAFPRFVDSAKKGVAGFAQALGSLASQFVPDWAKSLWAQIVDLGGKLAAKTAEIGNAIRNNLKISKSKDEPSVGDFRRGEYEGVEDSPPKPLEMPKFEPVAWTPSSMGSGGAGLGTATFSSQEKSEYEQAKKLYEQQLKLAEYTDTEKEALYKKYLENVQKSEGEAMDYRIGIYQAEKAALAETLKEKETELENSRTRGQVSELRYNVELAAIKKVNLDAETAYRAKSMMEAENLTEQEKASQLEAYKEKVAATSWYKEALKGVLEAEKTLADFQKSVAKGIAELEKERALNSIAVEEERLNTLREENRITQEELTEGLRMCEAQRYELEKVALEKSLDDCAKNAEEMKDAYLKYTEARSEAARAAAIEEMVANGLSKDAVISFLKEMDALNASHNKKDRDLNKDQFKERIRQIEQIRDTMKDSMSEAFQDVLTRSKSFMAALKNVWSTTMKAILKQFTDTIAETITNKGFKNQLDKLTKEKNKSKNKIQKEDPLDKSKVLTEQQIQSQLTAANAQGNAQRLAQDQMISQQQVMTTETKAVAQEGIEQAKDTSITASAQAAGAASVESIWSSIEAMIQMLPLLILMSALTGMFGGGGKEETTESTGPGINLGRNPDSYYKTPTLTGIPSFDVGSWRLPADTLAMVHKDEMIVPAKGGAAEGVRNLLAGGGGQGSQTINLSYSAAHYGRTNRDVQDEMRQNARFLVKTLNSEYRNFNRGKK